MAASGGLKNAKAIWLLVGVLVCAGVATIVMLTTVQADIGGEDADGRVKAVQRIVSNRPPGARTALVKAARSDTAAQVREAAFAGLTHFKQDADRPLFEEGTRDKDPRVRSVAADTLGTYNDAQATSTLINLVKSDPSDRVRMAALRGLARCEDPRAVVCILETAEKDEDSGIRLQAMKALLTKFKANIRVTRDPRNEAAWRDLIQRFKWDQRIRDAYAAAGVQLVDRPQDILGKDWHPERHQYK